MPTIRTRLARIREDHGLALWLAALIWMVAVFLGMLALAPGGVW